MTQNKALSIEQVWRVCRLAAITFGHAAWVGALGLDWPDRTALFSVFVGASEGAYRVLFPSGNPRLLHAFASIIATATAERPPSTVVTVAPSGEGATTVTTTAPVVEAVDTGTVATSSSPNGAT